MEKKLLLLTLLLSILQSGDSSVLYHASFKIGGFEYGVIDHEVTKASALSMCKSKGSHLAVLTNAKQLYTVLSRIEDFLLRRGRPENSTSFWVDSELTKNVSCKWNGDKGSIPHGIGDHMKINDTTNPGQSCVVLVFPHSISLSGPWKPVECGEAVSRVICQRKISPFSMQPCLEGRCDETVSVYKSECYPGVVGPRCSLIPACNLREARRIFRVMNLDGQPLKVMNILPNTTVTVSCLNSEETLVGPERLTCIKDREWRPNKAQKCVKPVRCHGLSGLDHGGMILIGDNQTMFHVGTRVLFHCDKGYSRKGGREIECTDSGAWSGPIPYCAATTCIRNASKVINRRCNKPCRTDLTCDSPLEKCLCDDWCGKSCFDPSLSCEDLVSPRFGYILGTQRRFGNTVMYDCHSGYLLSGPQHRRCRSDGKWTGVVPRCLPYNSCGQAGFLGNTIMPTTIQKVVRGQAVSRDAWPWQVMLVHNNRNKIYESLHALLGGATIINRRWILSSAHLFDGFRTNEQSKWLYKVLIVVGISQVPQTGERLPSELQIYQPKQVIRHKNYNKVYFDYDVSLIRIGSRMIPTVSGVLEMDAYSTSSSFTFGKYVRPVCLPCINDQQFPSESHSHKTVKFLNFARDKCETRMGAAHNAPTVVLGFGDKSAKSATDLFLRRSDVLRQGFLQILQEDKCIRGVEKIRMLWSKARFTDRMLCTRGKIPSNLVDACVGDSGGPLLQRVVSSTGHNYWIQVGIVSWGWGCANIDSDGYAYPGYFTNVTSIVDWIALSLKQHDIKGLHAPQSRGAVTETGSESDVVTNVIIMDSKMFYRFNFRIDTTINFVKKEIETLLGYPKDKQTVFYRRKRLADPKTLQFYHFRSGGLLSVFVSQTV